MCRKTIVAIFSIALNFLAFGEGECNQDEGDIAYDICDYELLTPKDHISRNLCSEVHRFLEGEKTFVVRESWFAWLGFGKVCYADCATSFPEDATARENCAATQTAWWYFMLAHAYLKEGTFPDSKYVEASELKPLMNDLYQSFRHENPGVSRGEDAPDLAIPTYLMALGYREGEDIDTALHHGSKLSAGYVKYIACKLRMIHNSRDTRAHLVDPVYQALSKFVGDGYMQCKLRSS